MIKNIKEFMLKPSTLIGLSPLILLALIFGLTYSFILKVNNPPQETSPYFTIMSTPAQLYNETIVYVIKHNESEQQFVYVEGRMGVAIAPLK